MPLYRCLVRENLTSLEQRHEVSKEVTRIHCEITGAPPTFVHTFFTEDAGGDLPTDTGALLLGSIRSGRTDEQKQQLVDDMQSSIASILDLASNEVTVATADIPARWVMEGGALLPEPGDEDAWLEKHGHVDSDATG